MQLHHATGTVTIELEGFADGAPEAGGFYDEFDWLMVRVCVAEPERTFVRSDPCLFVSDAIYLIDWLYAAADDVEMSEQLAFMEPALSFEMRNGVLKLTLAAECKPPWARESRQDLTLAIKATRKEIAMAADELKLNLKRILPTAERSGVSFLRDNRR